jgi:glycosyltransferase involved in cell wall biosynthesis
VKVGFDVTALLAGATGVARYVHELAAALEEQGIELRRFAIGRESHGAEVGADGVRRIPIPLRVVHLSWALVREPSAERLAPGCDVMHTPDLVPPPTRRPLVLTVHDLAAVEWPELHPRRAVQIQRRQLAVARDRADVVMSDSHATADALRSRGVDGDRIVVAPIGVTAFPAADASMVPDDPYLLAVGALTPRKNLEGLVAAFARASLPDRLRLVLAGPPGWGAHTVLAAIERHRVSDRVIRTGSVTDAQLAGLYEGCLAVCVPSRAEGFGLPVIEAGAAGAPVLASDLAVFREVGEGVALHVPPADEQAWAAALERIVTDEDLRREAAARGRTFARRFTWERTAAITASAYERAREAA